jgi:DNA polymerase I-like protein with 3'-5' exonuclease and polymerase domains
MKTDGQRRVVFLDIETTTDHNQIHLCVTKDQRSGVVECHRKAETLLKTLEDKPLLVAHNGIFFDFPILNRLWNTKIVPSMCIDTLVMSRLMNPSRENGHSLAAWATSLGTRKIDYSRVWFRINKLKFIKDSTLPFDSPHLPLLEKYCRRDVEVLEKVYNALLKEKDQYGFSQDSIELEHQVAVIISKQERNGFRFDMPSGMVLRAELKDKMASIQASLHDIFPTVVTERTHKKTGKRLKDDVEVFNPGSRQQIAKRLIEKGWKPKKYTEKGQVVVDELTLAGVDIPEARAIAEYLLIQKRVAMVESWINSVSKDDNRIHGKVITNGAVTGRMTHSTPNMAQVPSVGSEYGAECRSLFIVEKGYKLVGCDAASLELRMLAHYMKDEQYAREIVEGDIHTKNQTAAGLETRAQAKTFIYALLYGAGPAKIGKIVGGSAAHGQKLIDTFLRNTPSLKRLRDKVEKLSVQGSLPGLDGRRLFIRSSHAALNTLLQGAGAIVMKKALVLLDEQLRRYKLDAKFVVNVHDEFQLEVKEEHAQRVGELAVDSIKKSGVVLGLRCPLDGEYKIGDNWCQTH